MRRTKDLLKDKLPSKTVELNYIKLRKEERETYDVLFDAAKLLFESLLALDSEGSVVMKNYNHILECLLRLRQGESLPHPTSPLSGSRPPIPLTLSFSRSLSLRLSKAFS